MLELQDENQAPVCEIGLPYDLKHDVHIHYNFTEARFEGVPANFAEYLAVSSGQYVLLGKTKSSSPGASAASAISASISSLGQRAKRSRTGSASTTASAGTSAAASNSTATCNTTNTCSSTSSSPSPTDIASCSVTDPLVLLNQHFKLPYRHVPRLAVAGYDDRIPAVLVMLQHHFVAKRGYLAPHIFRESPNKADRDQAMREINSGTFVGARHDVRVLADLIKLWFRELPVPIFHEIRSDQMEQLVHTGSGSTSDLAATIMSMLGPLEKCIVLWLADLLAHVASFQDENHMGVDQLAIVIAPNLVRIETANPMLAVTLSKASVDLFRAILRTRFDARRATAAASHDFGVSGEEASHGPETSSNGSEKNATSDRAPAVARELRS